MCGCGVSRRYIDVCYCDMFSVVNVYLDHLKFCVVCINSRRYVCCSECDVVSNESNEPTSCLGGVCDMCMCLAWGGEGGEWMRELGLGFTNPVGTGGVLDICLYFGCGSVGGVGGEWVGGLDQGRERWGICVLCLADTCTSEVHPVFNPLAPYGHLLSDMYLFMADITNPDFLV